MPKVSGGVQAGWYILVCFLVLIPCNIITNAQSTDNLWDDCDVCIAGKYSDTPGSYECTPCVLGTFSLQLGANNSNSCRDCFAGTYSIVLGSNSSQTCQACVAGKFSTQIRASDVNTCQDCPSGKFSGTTGANSDIYCQPCAAGTIAIHIGIANASMCFQILEKFSIYNTSQIVTVYGTDNSLFSKKIFVVDDSLSQNGQSTAVVSVRSILNSMHMWSVGSGVRVYSNPTSLHATGNQNPTVLRCIYSGTPYVLWSPVNVAANHVQTNLYIVG